VVLIGTYVPNSAIWWASYGALQKQIWKSLEWWKEQFPQQLGCQADTKAPKNPPKAKLEQASVNEVILVQTSAALLSGKPISNYQTYLYTQELLLL